MDYRQEVTGRLTELWEGRETGILKGSPEIFNRYRTDAFSQFLRLGIPDRKNEAYRYTNLEKSFSHKYEKYFSPKPDDFREAERFHCEVEDLDVWNMVLLNGFFPRGEEGLAMLPGGIWVGSMRAAAKQFPSLVEKHYNKYAKNEKDGLVSLNTALATDGLFIYAPGNTVNSKPIQIVNLLQSEQDFFSQDRNLLIADDGARMSLLVCDHAISPQHYLTNTVTEIFVGRDASFEIIRVQNQHNYSGKITHTFIHQERDSYATSNNITLHGGLVRNATWHKLNGENAETHSYGLFLADRQQHIANFVKVDHVAPNCNSTQLFKGILDENATGAFNGRIMVHKDAQNTNAYQSNNNIILSDTARMDTKPQLEIYADDVKCSHGATVGQLDENALFYLRSRGIDAREAKLMLMFGFAHDVVKNIPIEALRDRIDHLVVQRLRGELSYCASCAIQCN
ncbi:MAG TPA: Fe-S cluster assembly protein SufD [Bacteroidales bacterium]|jgi:Fe-S cluster assembly protein SufD|nr:Fe-S cluster assembly protein SufD [Bacteroidales bacterium]MDI9532329.1 Fe-S cluster assembly protein SufD [Bacteroidota bacterium]OPZ57384.1 MAG: FeS cluster assembly protein SufD [Bacteroidetes bacterium ADurb.BinA012]MBK7731849.1 Fe-S cluster assembly protein SufD [Bacteroidales bacterium]MBP7035300.1 Fe-S cluster assembly protein SufD [Bacteroidales bacterium]